ncbi:sensor histidine kinase [Lacticaseibacillus paracasei]|uniref:Sensory histidine kinase DcuS n=1 Tax=Lacticaseibacillus paracasei TaxID=1597 RepID=A0A8B3GKP6_LACPA|nr:GHKL domain-containing protein [Lacticaseibacillus paracasei]RNE27739.1 sensory histidine kinase DcuS [Lacticaseibacillus paracasei]
MTVNEWWWLAAFGLLTVGCCLLLWWTFRRQQNWPVRGLNLAVTLLALGGWWLWPLPSVRFVLFCSTVLTGTLEFVLMRQFLNDQDAVFARSLDKMMAQYSQEVQELYANMRGWRHDYHDHLQALKAYLDNQNTQAARAYLDELEDKLDEVDPLVHSGNAMLDAIVNAKLTLAERLHIPVNEKVIVGSTPLIKDVDLVVILGNLLDNAIEAISEQPAGEPRQLRLYIGIVKQQFYISVTNTRPADQEIDYQYASPKSDKRGLGIRRVNKLVAKYNGMINRQYEASVFVTEIAIPIHAVKSTTHA